jgi:hypothetical protein
LKEANVKTRQGAVDTWLGHVRVLAEEIGPRGSTTEGERKGSEYCRQALADLGLSPAVESFHSARSIYFPHLLAASAMLLAFAIYPLAGRVSAAAAAVLSLAALVSDLLELSFIPNPLRWLTPKGPSQNVVGVVPASGEHCQDIVLFGHVDTHRTPIIFSSPRWVAAYKAFTTLIFLLFVGQAIVYVVGTVTGWGWIWPASLLSVLGALGLMGICLQADGTPFNAGANDNATGAGLVLALGEHLASSRLRHTRVWLVCTGCEEVQHYGAIDFLRRHRPDLASPKVIAFEMLGCAGPAWVVKEGIVIPFRADPSLVAHAEALAAAHPEWSAFPSTVRGGNTEMADGLRCGFPSITLSGLTPGGDAPYWHMAGDTYDKIDPEILGRAWDFVRAYLDRLDAAAP